MCIFSGTVRRKHRVAVIVTGRDSIRTTKWVQSSMPRPTGHIFVIVLISEQHVRQRYYGDMHRLLFNANIGG
jgi:hypothetical protein